VFSFNLVSEPWIPVRTQGQIELLSLEQALLRAAEIECIEDPSPLVAVALHRLLLAVLYRALQGPQTLENNLEWLENGFPNELIQKYFIQWKHRFDLFDLDRPFFQVPDLHLSGFNNQPKSWTVLDAEVSDGGQGADIFNHENRRPEPITPDLAVRILLSRQTFALGGLSRTFVYSSKRSPSPSAIFLIPQGRNLLETLCYNLDPNNFALLDFDIPFWESESSVNIALLRKKNAGEVMGCVQAYTWMSRSVKLVPKESEGKIAIEEVFFTSGLAPEFDKERYFDPMVGTQIVRSGPNKGEHMFSGFRDGRQFWRDFHSLFPVKLQAGVSRPRVIDISLRLYSEFGKEVKMGVYGICNATQEAKIDFARQEVYLLPEALSVNRLSDVYSSLEDAMKTAEVIGESLVDATQTLALKILSHGSRKVDKGDVTKMVDGFPTFLNYWSTLEKAFSELLIRLTADYRWEVIEKFWIEQVIQASDRAWELTRNSVGDDAFALRAIYSAEGSLRIAQKPFREKLKPAKETA
jgi:CRISPR system Cascade subunit CasA